MVQVNRGIIPLTVFPLVISKGLDLTEICSLMKPVVSLFILCLMNVILPKEKLTKLQFRLNFSLLKCEV